MTTERKKALRGSVDYQILVEHVSMHATEGYSLDYLSVTQSTGVKMDTVGRTKLARAIQACGWRALHIRNVGYELSSPSNTPEIMIKRKSRSLNQIAITHATGQNLMDRHGDSLPPDVKVSLNIDIIVTGEMLNMASRKKILKSIIKQLPPSEHVPLP